jgi:cytochrome c biogenesis protein CcmG, thiol:disulfide interchange protein DsbE
MRRIAIFAPLALFLLLVGLFGVRLLTKPVTQDGREALPSALIGKPVPAFDLASLAGTQRMTQAALITGKPVLVNFFASWCTPCRAEHPYLAKLAQDHGVTLIGVAYKDRTEDTQRFLAQLGDPFTAVAVDDKGTLGIDFGIAGVPETFVIDGSGKVVFRQWGPVTTDAQMQRLLRITKDAQS